MFYRSIQFSNLFILNRLWQRLITKVQGFIRYLWFGHFFRYLWSKIFTLISKSTLSSFFFNLKPKKFEVQIYFFELVTRFKSACCEPWHLDYLAKGLWSAPRWSGSCHRPRPNPRSRNPEKTWFSSTEFEPRFSCPQPLTSNNIAIFIS